MKPKKKRNKTELVDHTYLDMPLAFAIILGIGFGALFLLECAEGYCDPVFLLPLPISLAYCGVLVLLRRYKLSFNRTGIVIRLKRGETLTIHWTEFEYYRLYLVSGNKSYYHVLLVRKGRLPDDLIPSAAMGEFPSNGVILKYDLHRQIKRYYKGTITREEFLDSDAYILYRSPLLITRDWKKFNDVTEINKVVPWLRGSRF